ncbi:MAG TPA: glycerol-3-phosphate acyltransferase [Aggregatilineales bacterium]|nr:glycerol-3-phosphate acyltransferase [Anaerolineae bacterium]HUN08043.1 glycerol-3-phosphate acyltransferase [Aggregatilineales bacterium]
MTATVLLVVVGFFMGSLPFSYWIGRYGLKQDIRQVGDGNPGATNVLRAGGKRWAILAGLLDALKGTIPVGIAYFGLGFHDLDLVAVALSPVLGHAFSPILRFSGGKAVAVTFGIWAGMTLWQVPIIMGLLLLLWVKTIQNSGWSVVLMLLGTWIYLGIFRPEPSMLAIIPGLIIILGWKYRADLRQLPFINPMAEKVHAK